MERCPLGVNPAHTQRPGGRREEVALIQVRAGLSATNAAMSWRSAMAGVSALLGSVAPVSGLVLCVHSQRKISRRSYVCLSDVR